MNIVNIREGFATNSSSSHSIVLKPKGRDWPEAVDQSSGEEFGWDWFLLTTPSEKMSYLAQQMRRSGFEEAEIQRITGIVPNEGGYIDHESVGLPIPREHIEDFRDYLLLDDVAIRGGNDNDSIPEAYLVLKNSPVKEIAWNKIRKDGDFYVSFNPNSGLKVRFSFTGHEYLRSSWPELVDMKITDYCPLGCSYCYQGSTMEGQHAKMRDVRKAIDRFADVGVFELALGGGETTMHPRFDDILAYARKKGIVPNFTTRSLGWLRRASARRERILEAIGGFAYSVDTAKEVRNFIKLRDKAYPKLDPDPTNSWETRAKRHEIRDKFSIQLVMGVISRKEFKAILKLCAEHRLRVTLLGYKYTGRGKDVIPEPYDWWLEDVFQYTRRGDYRWIESDLLLGIDTELARQYEDYLVQRGINEKLFSIHEGTHSCYVDAVAGTLAPSSYSPDPRDYRVFDEDWIKTYQNFDLEKKVYIPIAQGH